MVAYFSGTAVRNSRNAIKTLAFVVGEPAYQSPSLRDQKSCRFLESEMCDLELFSHFR